MTEDYLQHVWLFSNFNNQNLQTTENEEIQILNKGTLNHDSGPDFLNAKIKINNTLWIGHVEIHIKSSYWNLHKHQNDPAYNNVILHVVLEDDQAIFNEKNDTIPTLELRELIYQEHYDKYFNHISLATVYPCENQLKNIDAFKISNWFHNLAFQRLMSKVEHVLENLNKLKGDWEYVMYLYLAKSLGMKVNQDAMEELVLKTPWKIIQKESFSQFSLEALLFGQSGLLKGQNSAYAKSLSEEYFYIKQKYSLLNMAGVEWRFSRMRPANFPTLRLAQLASIFSQYQNLFSLIRDKEDLEMIRKVLAPDVSEYWQTHYRFGTETSRSTGKIGKQLQDSIIINVVVQLAMAYGKYMDDETYNDYGMNLLEQLGYEQNKKSKFWIGVNGVPDNAIGSQASIQLLDEYCLNKKCLSCGIGVEILKK